MEAFPETPDEGAHKLSRREVLTALGMTTAVGLATWQLIAYAERKEGECYRVMEETKRQAQTISESVNNLQKLHDDREAGIKLLQLNFQVIRQEILLSVQQFFSSIQRVPQDTREKAFGGQWQHLLKSVDQFNILVEKTNAVLRKHKTGTTIPRIDKQDLERKWYELTRREL